MDSNITLGTGVFLNFNCVILDVVEVTIRDKPRSGRRSRFSPPITAQCGRRASGLEFGRRIRIGCNVWVGGGAIILPGVAIADDAVIGAGAVVTRDVMPGAVVARQSGASDFAMRPLGGESLSLLTRRAGVPTTCAITAGAFTCRMPSLPKRSTPRSRPATMSGRPPRARCATRSRRRSICSTAARRASPSGRPTARGASTSG